jgi:hypothetical protein
MRRSVVLFATTGPGSADSVIPADPISHAKERGRWPLDESFEDRSVRVAVEFALGDDLAMQNIHPLGFECDVEAMTVTGRPFPTAFEYERPPCSGAS